MSKKIRILEAIRQGQVGGGETHVYDLSTRLDKNKFHPIVLSFTEGEMVDNLRAKGIETHVIHTTTPFDPRVVQDVKKLTLEKEIDIVHAHGTRAASNTLKAARSLKLPIIYTIHGWSFNNSQSKAVNFLRTQTESYITKRTSLNICVSESNQESGKNAIRDFQSIVINNGISLDKFNFNVSDETIRAEINKKEGEIWVGFIARLTYQKDPLTLLKAFEIAQKENDNLRLLIVGGGELEEEVMSFINEKDLNCKVKVLPFRSDVPSILKTIDIYCLPSLWEGLPIGILEAMAMKKPVIATRVDGTKEIIDPTNGVLIETKDIDGLSDEILKISQNRNAINSMGEQGFKKIQKHFLIDQMVELTQTQYASICT